MERKDAIQNAYHLAGSNSFYDGMITCSTVLGKVVCRAVWGMGKAECNDYLAHALSGIPENFVGRLLEIPVGTGILTMPVYQTLPHADITCLDYSPDMMGQAQEKAAHLGGLSRNLSCAETRRHILRLLLCAGQFCQDGLVYSLSVPTYELFYPTL